MLGKSEIKVNGSRGMLQIKQSLIDNFLKKHLESMDIMPWIKRLGLKGNSGALSAQRRDKSITTAGDVLGERKAKTGWFMICDFNSSKAGSSSLGASNGNNKEQCMDFISK
ncbi:hypothetical protein DNTS_021907 [Danionella cerebrum]|uniref:Uncharacterized protein n=1 Tax=Danionella cerebrum TaxID=2873325 RepID=A0A553Q1F7_9TELE|nr:hypothetical protein DNTS_021907 [Danionella translucida]